MTVSPDTQGPTKSGTSRRPDAVASVGRDLVARLRVSFASGTTRPWEWRRAQLDGLRTMLLEREEEILEALRADVGKPLFEGYAAEVAYLLGAVSHARRHLKEWMEPDKVPTPVLNQPGTCRVVKEPLGVVLVIAPWNYPLGLAISPLVGAVAAGNCAVVKPSEIAPTTSALIAQLVPEYLDEDCIAVVEGGVAETTDLLEQPWDHILYTGNGRVARIVMAAAAKHLTPVTLELGGKSPCIVHRDVNLPVAVKRIAWGKWYNAGQTCVAPDYVLVHREIHDELVSELGRIIRRFWGDDPQQSPDYGRIVNRAHHDRLARLMESGDIAYGGQLDRSDRYIAPTVLTNVDPDSPIMAEEIFGPLLPVLKVDDIDGAIRFVNARPKPLALYAFTEDARVQQRIIDGTSAGGMTVNHSWMHISVHDLPFGGVGESGMGAYHGKASFDCFTHEKSVLVRSTALDPPFVYPPYSTLKQKLLRRLL